MICQSVECEKVSNENWNTLVKKAKKIEKKGGIDVAAEIYNQLLSFKNDKVIKKRLNAIVKAKTKQGEEAMILSFLSMIDHYEDADTRKLLEIINIFIVSPMRMALCFAALSSEKEREKFVIKICNIFYENRINDLFEKLWELRDVNELLLKSSSLREFKIYLGGYFLFLDGNLLDAYQQWSQIPSSLTDKNYLNLKAVLVQELSDKVSGLFKSDTGLDLEVIKKALDELRSFSWEDYIEQYAFILTSLWNEEKIPDILNFFSGKDFFFWEACKEDETLFSRFIEDRNILNDLQTIFNIFARASFFQFHNLSHQSTDNERQDYYALAPFLIESSFYDGVPRKIQNCAFDLVAKREQFNAISENHQSLYAFSREMAKTSRVFDVEHKGKKIWFYLSILSQFIDDEGQEVLAKNLGLLYEKTLTCNLKNNDIHKRFFGNIFWTRDFQAPSSFFHYEYLNNTYIKARDMLRVPLLQSKEQGLEEVIACICRHGENVVYLSSLYKMLFNKSPSSKFDVVKSLKKLSPAFDFYEVWQLSFILEIEKNKNNISSALMLPVGENIYEYYKKLLLVAPSKVTKKYLLLALEFELKNLSQMLKIIDIYRPRTEMLNIYESMKMQMLNITDKYETRLGVRNFKNKTEDLFFNILEIEI